jgi:hypothetical protein
MPSKRGTRQRSKNRGRNRTAISQHPAEAVLPPTVQTEPESSGGRGSDHRVALLLGLLLAFALGAFLRVTLLSEQILIDDEWHGLNFTLDKTLWEILTGFDPKDNSSMPLNLYRRFLLDHFGWSETALRLPALAAGLLLLVLLPLRVRRVVGDRAAVTFALLLAIAPFQIFYSRFSRAFSLAALFGFLSLFSFFAWWESGRRRDLIVYLVTGALAVYFHPTALIAVAIPLLLALFRSFFASGQVERKLAEVRSTRTLLAVGGGLFLLVGLPLVQLIIHRSELPLGADELTLGALLDAAVMLSGTGSFLVAALFIGAIAAGLFRLFRRRTFCAVAVVATLLAYLFALACASPEGSDTAVVVLRYCMAVVPAGSLLAALGFDHLLEALERRRSGDAAARWAWWGWASIATAVGLLLYLGPFAEIYKAPNNFTSHSAFQGSYAPPAFDRADVRHVYPSYALTREEMPPFYSWVAKQPNVRSLIEYPFDITNFNNLYYFYQRVHGKSVRAGYACMDERFRRYRFHERAGERPQPGPFAGIVLDSIFCRIEQLGMLDRMRFGNLVDVRTVRSGGAGSADLLVVHKEQRILQFRPDGLAHPLVSWAYAPELIASLEKRGAVPVFEDDRTAAFGIE